MRRYLVIWAVQVFFAPGAHSQTRLPMITRPIELDGLTRARSWNIDTFTPQMTNKAENKDPRPHLTGAYAFVQIKEFVPSIATTRRQNHADYYQAGRMKTE